MKLLILVLLPVFVFSQPGLEKITLLNNKVELLVPKELKKMPNEMIASKYPKDKQPLLLLNDAKGKVNLIAYNTQQLVSEDQMTAYKNFQMESLQKNHPEMHLIGNGMKIVNGKKVGFLKFISKSKDLRVFNYYFLVSVDNKALMFTFNCLETLRSKWEKTANSMLASLKVK